MKKKRKKKDKDPRKGIQSAVSVFKTQVHVQVPEEVISLGLTA